MGDKSLNQRGLKITPGSLKKDFQGRHDYSSGRPTKDTERVPELGDRGIPAGISSNDGSVMKGPVQDIAGGGSKGIPPMKANPTGIGITIKGVTTKDTSE
jgi:hypothetical protein